jgi:hypothetical protein
VVRFGAVHSGRLPASVDAERFALVSAANLRSGWGSGARFPRGSAELSSCRYQRACWCLLVGDDASGQAVAGRMVGLAELRSTTPYGGVVQGSTGV